MRYETPSLKYVSLNIASTILAASSIYTPDEKDLKNPSALYIGTSGIETTTGYISGGSEQQFDW